MFASYCLFDTSVWASARGLISSPISFHRLVSEAHAFKDHVGTVEDSLRLQVMHDGGTLWAEILDTSGHSE